MACIKESREDDRSTLGDGHTVGHFLLGIVVHGEPIVLLNLVARNIRLICVEDNGELGMVFEVTEDTSHGFHVTLPG